MDHLHSSGSRSAEKVTPASENAARRAAMLDIVDDVDDIASILAKRIGWGNGAVFDPEHRCECAGCEQERDDVRAAIYVAFAATAQRIKAEASAVSDDRSAANATEVAR